MLFGGFPYIIFFGLNLFRRNFGLTFQFSAMLDGLLMRVKFKKIYVKTSMINTKPTILE